MRTNHPLTAEQQSPSRLLVDSKRAAQMLSISQRTLWTLTDSGKLSCVRIGRAVRYSVAELERFVAEHLLVG